MYLVALNLQKKPNQLIVQLNSSLRQIIDSLELQQYMLEKKRSNRLKFYDSEGSSVECGYKQFPSLDHASISP